MPSNKKTLAFHGISNAKYALKTGNVYSTTPVNLLYSKTLALNTVLEKQEVYADNRNILTIPSDQGYDGTYGTTGQDVDFETAAGMVMKLDNGLATIKQTTYKRFAIYYEIQFEFEGETETIKAWALNAEFSKPNESNQTDTKTATIGEYVYPIKIYGEKVMKDDTVTYRDAKGNEVVALIVRSFPGDADYATFGDTVPTPTKAA